jgi:hypothetical protein
LAGRVPAGQILGHDSFVSPGHDLSEEVAAATNHSVGIRHDVITGSAEQLTQTLATLAKRLPQQRLSVLEEQIEDDVTDRNSPADRG